MVRIKIGRILSSIDYFNHFYIDNVFTKSRYPYIEKRMTRIYFDDSFINEVRINNQKFQGKF